MPDTTLIDSLNRSTMRSAVPEYAGIAHEALSPAEAEAIAAIVDKVKNGRILDIGIGAGRTVEPLRAVSKNYVGVDYVAEMVNYCRERFSDVHFELADARSMPQFADQSFDLIVFACNGISMVDQAGRLAILREVRRLLAPGGYFLFSTCNRNSPQHDSLFAFPDFQMTKNPAKLIVRSLRFVAETAYRLFNRYRFKRHEIKTPDYSILNDRCHHYQTMLYFIDIKSQQRQLLETGFKPPFVIYDIQGLITNEDCRDGTLTFLVSSY